MDIWPPILKKTWKLKQKETTSGDEVYHIFGYFSSILDEQIGA